MDKRMSETEQEIMEVFWQREDEITSQELLQFFREERGKTWKIQTFSTFLSRLCKKGLLEGKQKGRNYSYRPLLTREEYNRRQAKGFLDSMYNGSISNFISALGGREKLSKDDINSLKEWIEEERF